MMLFLSEDEYEKVDTQLLEIIQVMDTVVVVNADGTYDQIKGRGQND